ncbi:MAG: hypothetical protein PHO23_01805 [Candidatus Pacebacteria bacterium]|nr:hypothetical protein [Candidatus Paceibacterota bacterium]
MCPEMEGVQCYYDCIGHKCEWVIDMPNTSQIEAECLTREDSF